MLNGLAILGVVLNHAGAWGFIGMFWWADRYRPVTVPNFDQMGSAAYYALRLVEQLITFSVPAFLFVSGFFIAFVASRKTLFERWKVAGSRIATLVVPYILWSAVIFFGDYLQGQTYTPIGYLRRLVAGRAADPYYFIPLLVQLYLLSPLFLSLAQKRWKLLLFITAIIQFAVQSLRYPVTLGAESEILTQLGRWPLPFFPAKWFWFVFGIVVSLHLNTFRSWLVRVKRGLLAALVALLTLGIVEWELLLRFSPQDWIGYYETSLDSLYATVFILCYLAYDQVSYPLSQRLSDLGSKSYGVYLIHAPVLEVTARGIAVLLPWLMASQLLFQSILVALGLGIPLTLMVIANLEVSPVRSSYRYIFG